MDSTNFENGAPISSTITYVLESDEEKISKPLGAKILQ